MGYLKDSIHLGKRISDVCSAKGFAMTYPRTKFHKTSSKELYNMVNNTEEFLTRPKSEILEIFKEISVRLSKGMNVPVKKIELETGVRRLIENNQFYNARTNFGDDDKMYFCVYPVEEFKKLVEDYDLDNYLFAIAHENRHAYQFYKFGNIDKNSNEYVRINFMRNEQIMRYYLNNLYKSNLVPENDYLYNSLERDANYYAIDFYMGLVQNKKIDFTKEKFETFIEEMLDYNQMVDGKESSQLQLENYIKILNSFQHNIDPKVYEKFAKKSNLESETELTIMQESLQKREQNVKYNLYDCLKIYFEFLNKNIPNGYSKERFDKLIKEEKYGTIYSELYDIIENSGLDIKPTTKIIEAQKEPLPYEFL